MEILYGVHSIEEAVKAGRRRFDHVMVARERLEAGQAARLERLVEPACQLTFSSAGVPDPLPAAVEVAAYRIAVEAVLNAVRHARPTRCAVALVGRDGGLALEVADDGVGLPAGAVGHVGLRSMRERAEELGGTIAFEVDAGTAVRAFLPFIPTTRTSP